MLQHNRDNINSSPTLKTGNIVSKVIPNANTTDKGTKQGDTKSIEYNGRYFIAEEIIKSILQKEYDRHNSELKRHWNIFDNTKSNRQKARLIKHFHKRFQTERIAELLNIKLKKQEKRLNEFEFLNKICDVHNSDYRAIKERIKEIKR
jgi:hypothetical protein